MQQFSHFILKYFKVQLGIEVDSDSASASDSDNSDDNDDNDDNHDDKSEHIE